MIGYPKQSKIKKADVKSLDKKLWTIFSKYIRMRDAYKYSKSEIVKCVTCNHIGNYKEFDAGHFISRRHLSTKFHDKNVSAQCKGCNGPKSGEQFKHGLMIDEKYGKGTAEHLLMLSKNTVKWGAFEYESLINDYNQRVKDLEKILKKN